MSSFWKLLNDFGNKLFGKVKFKTVTLKTDGLISIERLKSLKNIYTELFQKLQVILSKIARIILGATNIPANVNVLVYYVV